MGESRPFHHSVQLYHEESDLVDALARFAEGGLAQGEGVVVIGSAPRWKALTGRLRAGGIDTHGAVLRGQLRLFDAKVILSSCMGRGVPDRLAFDEAIERFWNAFVEGQPLSLLCACPLDALDVAHFDE